MEKTKLDGWLQCLSQTAADTITGTATHLNFTGTGEGQNGGADGSHEVTAEWYNSSMVGGEVIEGLSMDDIKEQIDSMGAGLGDHTVEISVAAQGRFMRTPVSRTMKTTVKKCLMS